MTLARCLNSLVTRKEKRDESKKHSFKRYSVKSILAKTGRILVMCYYKDGGTLKLGPQHRLLGPTIDEDTSTEVDAALRNSYELKEMSFASQWIEVDHFNLSTFPTTHDITI